MEIRSTRTQDDIEHAIRIDTIVIGSRERAEYLAEVARQGGLNLAVRDGDTLGFSCLDHRYFFGKPFISLLIVAPQAQRQGFGRHLLSHYMSLGLTELWTSTNRSNVAMLGLLQQASWQFCGALDGLDDGDPELFFKKPA